LADEADSVRITANHAVRLRVPSNETLVKNPPIVIQPDRRGLRINGRIFTVPRIRIEATSGTLDLTVLEGLGGQGKRGSPREWLIDGTIEVSHRGSKLLVINRVGLEEYVAGVVSGEINTQWHPEALKAQAVAARTYVLYKSIENSEQPYDVVSSVQDQVYRGRAHINKRVWEAVMRTKGRVVTFDDRPIYAAYSSTAAGPTEDALYVWALDLPYLKGVECPFDEKAPRYHWRTAIPLEILEQRLRKEQFHVGAIATITPYTFTPSGRVDRIRILHSRGQTILRGQDLRRVVGYSKIFSTQFRIESFGHQIVISGRGAGHGVGMCQWGMKEMAELGYTYEAIVQYYYPGTTLRHVSQVNLAPPSTP
jgi:stage II sporulation protein D